MSAVQGALNSGLSEFRQAVTPDFSGRDNFDLALERYALLGSAVEQAEEKSVISALPQSRPSGSRQYASSRVRTIRNRLFNLGYLRSDNGSHLIDRSLKTAIARFQSETGGSAGSLVVDGWVGERTWAALQELVSFESPSNVRRWFRAAEPSPAILRAAQLRLYTLGLIDDKPKQQVGRLNPALQRFANICRLLALSHEPVSPEVCPETLMLLFDQDLLVARLAESKVPTKVPERYLIRNFVMNMARIELWMLGFDIKPDGSELATMLDKRMELKVRTPMFRALQDYWAFHKADKTKASLPARMFVKSSFPAFFAQLLKDTATEKAVDSGEIYDCLEENRIGLDTVWEHVKAFGSRLWDGIRRIRGWFRNIIRKAANAAISFIKEISRLAYQYILKSYETVKAVIKGFCDSVSYLTHPVMQAPDGVKTVIRHDADFDYQCLVHTDDAASDVVGMAETLEIRARIFNISGRILSAFIGVLKRIAAGFIGWTWLLMGLLKLYKQTSHLVSELTFLQKKLPA